MATRFQGPKGTRDFYPDAMAVRRYIEDAWRTVSTRFGFLEVDGPTFEPLELYKIKSGDEIVSQLFHFQDRADRALALRPEFTPSLARMVAEKAGSLPRPIKWFSIPRCYRAEQPQKGRLREFIQWNADVLGDATTAADVELVAVCVAALEELGLTAREVRVGWNHRELLTRGLCAGPFIAERMPVAYEILDKLHKLDAAGQNALFEARECTPGEVAVFDLLTASAKPGEQGRQAMEELLASWPDDVRSEIAQRQSEFANAGLGDYCAFDMTIVRGLAYYTGFVFEAFDVGGANRALAGGGRYDKLVELLGGPEIPATGFGMGDVVLELVLREKNLLPKNLLPQPDVFVVNILPDPLPAQRLLAHLRKTHWNADHTAVTGRGLHAVTSTRATKNVGKLLQEAAGSGARVAAIFLPDEYARGVVKIKNMADRSETEAPAAEAVAMLRQLIGALR